MFAYRSLFKLRHRRLPTSARSIAGLVLSIFAVSACALGETAQSTGQAYANNTAEITMTKDEFIRSTQTILVETQLPGLSVVVVNNQGGHWAHGFGYADLSAKKPMTADNVLRIASVSKLFTGSAAMKAVEQGKLDLDTDINAYLPFDVQNPNHPSQVITLRHLLTHTSGIVDNPEVYFSNTVYHPKGDSPIQLSQFVEDYLTPTGAHYAADKNFSDKAVGIHFEYSNIAFALIGAILEYATNEPFPAYTAKHLFKPLEMQSTGWKMSDIDPELAAILYGSATDEGLLPLQGKIIGPWRAYVPYGLTTYPDGGLRTSANDLSRFLRAILNEGSFDGQRILKPETVRAMITPQRFDGQRVTGHNDNEDQGLAFQFESPALLGPEWTRIGHAGGDPGVRTGMYFDREREAGYIFFFNSDLLTEDQLIGAQTIVRNLLSNGASFIE